MLGHVHRAAQSDPHVTRSGTGSQRISRGCPETVEDYIANESPPEIAELALNREGEFRMLHPLSVSALGGGGRSYARASDSTSADSESGT